MINKEALNRMKASAQALVAADKAHEIGKAKFAEKTDFIDRAVEWAEITHGINDEKTRRETAAAAVKYVKDGYKAAADRPRVQALVRDLQNAAIICHPTKKEAELIRATFDKVKEARKDELSRNAKVQILVRKMASAITNPDRAAVKCNEATFSDADAIEAFMVATWKNKAATLADLEKALEKVGKAGLHKLLKRGSKLENEHAIAVIQHIRATAQPAKPQATRATKKATAKNTKAA